MGHTWLANDCESEKSGTAPGCTGQIAKSCIQSCVHVCVCLALRHFHDVVQFPPHRVEEDLAQYPVAQVLREVDRQAIMYP